MTRKKEDRRIYFAYGSNLHLEQMTARCPTAVPIRTLFLRNWRLVFRNVADIEPSEGDMVAGALYWVEPRDVAALDRYEGVSVGLYRQVRFRINSTGEEAFFYRMNHDFVEMPGRGYYRTIEEGFADWKLPHRLLSKALVSTAHTLAQNGEFADVRKYGVREAA